MSGDDKIKEFGEITPYELYVFDIYKLLLLNYANLYSYVSTLVVMSNTTFEYVVEGFKEGRQKRIIIIIRKHYFCVVF